MASHPYISGAGNITQMIGFLRKNFPATVTSDTVKKLGLAPKNESYVINALQFLGLIDEEGKRVESGHEVMTIHDENEFQSAFASIIQHAYSDLFEIRGDAAWTLSKDQLISYFRSADKTSDIIGSRQAGVFIALRELAGHISEAEKASVKSKATTPVKPKQRARAEKRNLNESTRQAKEPIQKSNKSDMALTVRIEINLPAEGTQETYDAIFKSIKENLYPCS